MKSVGLSLLYSALIVLAIGCGKDNRSGRANTGIYTGQFGTLGTFGSPYSFTNGQVTIPVDQVIAENPCISQFGGFVGAPAGAYGGQRIPIQIPLLNFPTVIPPGDIYVGVTSYGDVGVLAGTAVGQPPMFVGYLCPRAFAPNGQGQLMGVKPATYSNCLFKPIQAATVVFPGGASADFRMLDFGSSMRQRFSFCR
jgi:hypothetical protein